MKYLLVSIFSLLLLLFSCEDNTDQDSKISEDELTIVTGINFTDVNGQAVGKTGNPNINSSNSLVLYPNPAQSIIHIATIDDTEYSTWIIPSNKNLKFKDTDYTNVVFDYSDEKLFADNILYKDSITSAISFDITTLPTGYYRSISKSINGELTIINFYKDNAKNQAEVIPFLIEAF
ncbi:MAG: hypothetical protein V3V14_07850 [Saprospiraceae bacterium]